MEQVIKDWWGFGVAFILASIVALKMMSISQEAWRTGKWQDALWKTIGPIVSFLVLTTVGMTAFSVGFTNAYAVIKDSIPAQGLISLGNGITSLIAGGLESAPSIEVPQTSSLVEIIQNASESIAPQTNAAPASAPASNVESVAPSAPASSNWGVVREAPVAPTRELIGPVAPTIAAPAPTQGPAPRVEGPQEKPTFVDPASVFGGGPQTYTVKSGDSMAKIAKAVGLDDYRAICAANRAIVGNNCNVIRSGQVLVIP